MQCNSAPTQMCNSNILLTNQHKPGSSKHDKLSLAYRLGKNRILKRGGGFKQAHCELLAGINLLLLKIKYCLSFIWYQLSSLVV